MIFLSTSILLLVLVVNKNFYLAHSFSSYIATTTTTTGTTSTTKTKTSILPLLSQNYHGSSRTFLKTKRRQTNNNKNNNNNNQKSLSFLDATAAGGGDFWEDWGNKYDKETLQKENDKYLKDVIQKRVDRINLLEKDIEELDDDELSNKTIEFRKRLQNGKETLDDILEEAYAVVREASWRVLEQRHYDVQIIGGILLHEGKLAEMATGEGKTLVSTLPVYLNALKKERTSFVITVNDYLARRDMEQMGQIHKYLGLTVGLIQSNMKPEERRKAYNCDIVYVTNSELGFDYLRDHLAMTPDETVLPFTQQQQQSNQSSDSSSTSTTGGELEGFCVVDEADSVLIDEARTPLIISQQVPAPSQKYQTAKTIAEALTKDVHYTVDLKNKNIILNQKGYRDTEAALGIQSLFEIQPDGGAWAPYVSNAVKAKELFTKDVEYSVLVDNEGQKVGIGIIDTFTGRVLDGRRWSDGLHQSIECMEGIDVSKQSQVIAKITYQSLFRQFAIGTGTLSGMTGTAISDANEFQSVYGLRVVQVPTALPIARRDYPDVAWKTRKAANDALINECKQVGGGQLGIGRPCLIGTTSVEQSELLLNKLLEAGINEDSVQLLNASPKNAPRESEIVAQAGRAGVVTVATNMAGRGTDILLGGCSKTMSRIYVRSYLVSEGILKQEDIELCPPSPDKSYYPCDISDDANLLLKEATAALRKEFVNGMNFIEFDELLTMSCDATESDDDPVYLDKLRNAMEVVRECFKEVTDKEKEIVQSLGGLYVMGTNRHESSRIDLQLRGRSGRQGDPGTSRFFLSFEDDMFTIFGGDSLKKMLQTFRVTDDMPIEAEQITKALNRVQLSVEEKYREIRTEILKFDDVLNSQRKVIYQKRRQILFSSNDNIIKRLKTYNYETIEEIVSAQVNTDSGSKSSDTKQKEKTILEGATISNVSKVVEKVGQFFPDVKPYISEQDLQGLNDAQAIVNFCNVAIDEVLQEKLNNVGIEKLSKTSQYIMLLTLDNAWTDHLQNMESLKEGVILRKYQGLDPVAEYKNDAFMLYQNLQQTIRRNGQYSIWQNLSSAAAAASGAATNNKEPQTA